MSDEYEIEDLHEEIAELHEEIEYLRDIIEAEKIIKENGKRYTLEEVERSLKGDK